MIAIHSYKRAEQLKKLVTRYPFIRDNATIFIREDDAKEYINLNLPLKFKFYNKETLPEQKQYIVDYCFENNIKVLSLLDDDLVFGIRDTKDSEKIISASNENVIDMIELMQIICSEKYPMVHIPMRMGANTIKHKYLVAIQAIRAVSIYLPVLMKESIKYTDLNAPFMSDRYTQLSLLSKGYMTIGLGRYTVDDRGTNTKGGCSELRTTKNQSFSAKELHKQFVNYTERKVKNNGNWKESRIDIKIFWSKFKEKFNWPNYIELKEMEDHIKRRINEIKQN